MSTLRPQGFSFGKNSLLVGDNAVGIVDIAVGTGDGHDLGAQLSSLLADAPGHVAEAGDRDGLARHGLAVMLEDVLGVVDGAVAGGLGTDQAAAEGTALAGEHAVLIGVDDALVLAEQEADLTAAHAQIAGGHVQVGTDVTIELGHEALAEPHDLGIGLAGGIEVGTALAAAHGEAGQAVFEGLLKAQELHDGLVHVGSETEAALVRTDGAVELNTERTIDFHFAGIVDPGYPELNDPLGLDKALQQGGLLVLGVLLNDLLQGTENLFHGLNEFLLIRIAALYILNNSLDVCVHSDLHFEFCCLRLHRIMQVSLHLYHITTAKLVNPKSTIYALENPVPSAIRVPLPSLT